MRLRLGARSFAADRSTKYPHVADALKWLKLKEAVFDGEVVALDPSGKPNFQELQNARLTKLPIIYYVFDLLHLKGRDLLDRPLSERREQLEELAAGFADPLRLNPAFRVSLADFTARVQKLGLEGIVAKHSDSIYIPGKESDAWRKHRFNQEDEFVIGWYIPGGQNFSELLIGEKRGTELVFIKRLNALTEEVLRQCVWLKPERRCEVDLWSVPKAAGFDMTSIDG